MRRFLKILTLLFGLSLLLIGLSPYWLGGVLPMIVRRWGVTYETYSRVGYGRFALVNVAVRRPGVTVEVSRVEADTPWLWAIRHLSRADQAIVAGNWTVAVVDDPARMPRTEASGWVPLQARLSRLGNMLDRWLPHATIGPGRVSWPKGELGVGSGVWQKRSLHLDGLRWRNEMASFDAVFSSDSSTIQVRGSLPSRKASFSGESRGANVSGVLTVWEQAAPFEMRFEPAGWMPSSGNVVVENWRIPAGDLKLGGYTELQGGARATWDREHFELNADIHGRPIKERGAPELHVIARANGDRTAYTVDRLDIVAPGIVAKLSEPIRTTFRDSVAGPASSFVLDVNLAELPWFKAEGTLQGQVKVEPRAGTAPLFRFSGAGDKLAFDRWTASAFRLEGQLDWPRLTIESADLTSVDNAHFTLSGGCNFTTKELSAIRAAGRLTAGLVQAWLPKNVTFTTADLEMKAEGPWANARHEGVVKVDQLSIPGLVPAVARLSWDGSGSTISQFETGIQAGATEVIGSGSVYPDRVELKKLSWTHDEVERLALARPSALRWSPKLSVDAFDLSGPAGEMRLSGSWGPAGEVRFFARGIDGEWWRDFLPPAPFDWSINTFFVEANWNDGPATVNTSGMLFIDLQGRERIVLDLAAHSDGSSVVVERLRTLEEDREFATLHGTLPIALFASPQPRIEIGRSSELAIEGRVDPDARWWVELGKRTGIGLDRPDLSIQLNGTWEQPRGTALLNIARLQIDERFGKRKIPKIENVRLQLVADGSHLKLDPAEALVEGQPISLAATLPTNRETWDKLRKAPMTVLRDEVEISIRASNTDVAALAPYASGILLPQGKLDADLTLSIRGDWKGYLRLHDLGTRPLGSMGPLRDIQADLQLEGRRIMMKSVEAAMGGQPLKAEGFIEFPIGGEPQFDFSAIGENLPFVRQAGLLVRGNVNLKVASGNNATTPTVSGTVELRDGLFLSDVRALVPRGGGGASPERRPPYFSINAEPFNLWRLDVNVRGDRFLRARTPLFSGVASTKLHLVGTLGEPRALGELRIEEGQVLLPFASFTLNDATFRLSEENPYDPQLAVFGSSRRYNYDLKLELTGSASAPLLVFSSNPPLSSEQVLLIVMAGETPKDEVTYSASQRFTRFGTFFGQSLLGSLGGGGGGSDRLAISSGERVSDQGRETYDVQYRLDERWSVVGEYDEFDEYNVGLKWRVLPKQLRDKPNEKR